MADPRVLMPMNPVIKKHLEMEEAGYIPLRILCPQCKKIYTLFIKDFEQGLHCLLGQACPYCKRFIKESDDPEKLLVDLEEIRTNMKKGDENG